MILHSEVEDTLGPRLGSGEAFRRNFHCSCALWILFLFALAATRQRAKASSCTDENMTRANPTLSLKACRGRRTTYQVSYKPQTAPADFWKPVLRSQAWDMTCTSMAWVELINSKWFERLNQNKKITQVSSHCIYFHISVSLIR